MLSKELFCTLLSLLIFLIKKIHPLGDHIEANMPSVDTLFEKKYKYVFLFFYVVAYFTTFERIWGCALLDNVPTPYSESRIQNPKSATELLAQN